MKNRAKFAIFFAVLASLTGCEKDSDLVGANVTPSAEVKPAKNSIKRIVFANSALNDIWYDSSESRTMLDSQSNLGGMLAKNVYLILDVSSSTLESSCFGSGTIQQVMERAAFDFIEVIPSNSKLGVIRFDAEGPNEITSLESINVPFLKQLMSESKAGGDNPIAIAVSYAYKALQKQAEKQQGYGEYHIVLFTDGGSDNENELLAATRTIIESSPVVLHAYDFCPKSDNVLSANHDIEYKRLLSADDLRTAIHGTFQKVTISYTPPFEEDSKDSAMSEKDISQIEGVDEPELSEGQVVVAEKNTNPHYVVSLSLKEPQSEPSEKVSTNDREVAVMPDIDESQR